MWLGSWKVSVRTRYLIRNVFHQHLLIGCKINPIYWIVRCQCIKFCVSFEVLTQLSPSLATALDLSRKSNVARSDVLTAILTFPFFLGMIQFILVYEYQCFGRLCCFYLQGSPRRVGIPPGLIGIGYPQSRIFGLIWKRK